MNEIELAIKKIREGFITKEEAKRRYSLVEYKADNMSDRTRIMLKLFVSKTNILLEVMRRKGRVAYLAGHAKKIRTQKKNIHRLFRKVEKEMETEIYGK